MKHLSDATLRFIAWQHRVHGDVLTVDLFFELKERGLV